MSVLDEICARKAEHIKQQKATTPQAALEKAIQKQQRPRGFIKKLNAVAENGIALITEIKKASPSKGVIRKNFDPAEIARIYEHGGAACISVLTDTPYFHGSDDHLKAVGETVDIPLIRKDFMIDPYQIYESRVLGADCILLIMAALDDSLAQDLYALATELGMDTLVEIHDEAELEHAIALNPRMIGVNNRNLKTLEIDVQTSFGLLEKIPENVTKIAESGLADHKTISDLKASGFKGFLVGESLMSNEDIGGALKKLLGKGLTQNRN